MPTEKEKKINPKVVADLLDYNNKTGDLVWRVREGNNMFNSKCANKKALTCREKKGYLNGRILGTHMKAHRVAWCIYYGEWPDGQIDHINGKKDDNRIDNMRVVSNEGNCKNQSTPKSNTSGWCGVSLNKRKGKWVAKYKKDYRDVYVGAFACPTRAGIEVMIARRRDGFHANHGRT